MRNTATRFILVLLLLFAVNGVHAQIETAPPEQIVREKTDEIMALLQKNRDLYARNTKALYAMVEERALPFFDFERMSQWVLGRYWRQATPEQRQRFVNEFRDLLVRTYATALLNYTDQDIAILPSPQREGETRVVRTEIVQTGGAPNVPIYYSFYRNQRTGVWKVYDVTIEGVSLATNYRSIYANRIKKEGLDALIESIAQANRKDEQQLQSRGSKTP